MSKCKSLSGLAGAAALAFGGVTALAFLTPPAAAAVIDMTLHGFCGTTAASSTCSDNGVITPTSQNPLSPFGFTRSPDSNQNLTTPTFDLVFLVPSNLAGANSQVLIDLGHNVGTPGPLTETLFSTTPWTSGDLLAYLGLAQTGGPNNPIGAYLSAETNQGISGVSGFFVYQANFGSVDFGVADPYWTDTNSLLKGTVILGLIEGAAANSVQDATANSSAIIDAGTPPPPYVPEPGSLALLGTALAGLGFAIRRRRHPSE